MTTENKTKEDLQNDAVNFVYSFFKFVKYVAIIAVLLVGFSLYRLISLGN